MDVSDILFIKRRGSRVVVRNSSSVVEHGIAGPRVTGSIPVCSFFYSFILLINKFLIKIFLNFIFIHKFYLM